MTAWEFIGVFCGGMFFGAILAAGACMRSFLATMRAAQPKHGTISDATRNEWLRERRH